MLEQPRIPLARPTLPPLERYRDELAQVWDTRMLTNFGAQAQRFEALAREYADHQHLYAVSSCDVGLTLAVRALGPEPGSEAVLPAFTFASTVAAVLWNGLRPRFADVDPETFCLSPDAARSAIGPSTGLVLATHVFGVPCDVEALDALAGDAAVPLLYDAAHAFGTLAGGRHVSAWGDASVFSFDGTKIGTTAEGGLAAFADAAVGERFARLRTHGFEEDHACRDVGLNGKLSELHAALGCLTLPETEAQVERRAALVAEYCRRLCDVPGVRVQSAPERARPGWTYFAIDVGDRRDGLTRHLEAHGVQTKTYFRPLHEMPPFAAFPAGPLTETERLGRSLVCLPLYGELPVADVERICSLVRGHLKAVA